MTVESSLNILVHLIYLWIAGSSLLSWERQGDQIRQEIALVFISLAIAIIAQDAQRFPPALAPEFVVLFFLRY